LKGHDYPIHHLNLTWALSCFASPVTKWPLIDTRSKS
jgi:hypothetical protein